MSCDWRGTPVAMWNLVLHFWAWIGIVVTLIFFIAWLNNLFIELTIWLIEYWIVGIFFIGSQIALIIVILKVILKIGREKVD